MKGDALPIGSTCMFVMDGWNVGQSRRAGANYQRPAQMRAEYVHLPPLDLSSQPLDQFQRMGGLIFHYFGAIFSKNVFQRSRGITKKHLACVGVCLLFCFFFLCSCCVVV